MRLLKDNAVRSLTLMLLCLAFSQGTQAAGRVPTTYNQRYQALYAEQELFRKRPELLSCVYAARDFAQASQAAVFNKLRFTPASVQTGFVSEESSKGKVTRTVRMHGEGRVRAYSFLENWEPADIVCMFAAGDAPRVQLSVVDDNSSKDNTAVTKE